MEDSMHQMGFAVHRPKLKKAIRKSSSSKGSYETESLRTKTDKAALEHFQEPVETALIRNRLYQEHWIQLQSKINNFDQAWLSELTEEVVEFVNENVQHSKATLTQDKNEIPVGIIVTEETRDLMSSVLAELQTSIDFVLVRVSSHKCPNVKSAFQNIAKQLIHANPNVSRFVDTRLDDSDELEESMAEMSIRKYLSIHDVNSWYKSGKAKPYFIIVLDDVDLFPEKVCNELLLLLSCLKVNFALLLGVTSRFVPTTKFLSPPLLERWSVEEFMGPGPKERLDKFMDQVLYNLNDPFRLSGGVVQLLRNYFLEHNFSMSRLLQAYQICLMEHFRKPESLFCDWGLQSLWNSQEFLHLGEDEFLGSVMPVSSLIEVKGLPDRKCKSPTKSPIKRRRLFFNEIEDTKKETQQKLKQCYNEILEWYESFLILYQFGKDLPENPIGKTQLELYISASTGSIYQEHGDRGESSPFDKLLKTVQNFSPIEMEKRLGKALDEIKDFHKRNDSSKLVELSLESGIPEAVRNLMDSIQRAKALDMAGQEASTLLEKEPVVPASRCSPRKSKRANQPNFLEFITQAKEQIVKKKVEKWPEFTKGREAVICFIKGTLRQKLKKLGDIPVAQVFVFDDVEFVRKQLFPNLPKEIHLALCLPQNYLHCDCCDDTMLGSIDVRLPDTSIVYKLLLRHSFHVLDLNDLYGSFKSYHEPNEPKRRTPHALKKAKEEEANLLSRFAKACAELQFLGLLKRSKRKPDEATKLSWIFSNC